MTFEQVVKECLNTPGFLESYRRLTGASLLSGSVINNEIDKATGHLDAEIAAFVAFIKDAVWDRLPKINR